MNNKLHPLWNPFTADPKQSNFLWHKKVYWAWLWKIAWQMNLCA